MKRKVFRSMTRHVRLICSKQNGRLFASDNAERDITLVDVIRAWANEQGHRTDFVAN